MGRCDNKLAASRKSSLGGNFINRGRLRKLSPRNRNGALVAWPRSRAAPPQLSDCHEHVESRPRILSPEDRHVVWRGSAASRDAAPIAMTLVNFVNTGQSTGKGCHGTCGVPAWEQFSLAVARAPPRAVHARLFRHRRMGMSPRAVALISCGRPRGDGRAAPPQRSGRVRATQSDAHLSRGCRSPR